MDAKTSTSLPDRVMVTDSLGIRRLHFSGALIQGVMKVDDPDRLLLDYAHKMMSWIGFGLKPRSILLIGLGAGSVVRFIRKFFASTTIDVVEIDQRVINICHEQFLLPQGDPKIRVHHADGLIFTPNAVLRGDHWDLILVDAYGESAYDPGFGTAQFLSACAAALDDSGIILINTIGTSATDRPLSAPLKAVFGANVLHMTATSENNIIAIAAKSRSLQMQTNTQTAQTTGLKLRSDLWTYQQDS